MKKHILLLVSIILLLNSQSYSQLLVEDFDYPDGTVLSTTADWGSIVSSYPNSITVQSPGLTFPDYIGSGIGNAVHLPASRKTDTAFFGIQNSGNLYISFMVKVTAATQFEEHFFKLSVGMSIGQGYIGVRAATGGFTFALSKEGGIFVHTSQTYNYGVTYLLVQKYSFNPGPANDSVSLFVFDPSSPLPATEPLPTISPLWSITDPANLSTINLNHDDVNNNAVLDIDGIYIDNAWNNTVLPVELSSITSTVIKNDITLDWTTSSESNNSGFEIERSNGVNSWAKIGSVAGNGTVNTPVSYSFTDRSLSSGKYNYRLKQIDYNGNFEYHNLSNEVIIGIPSAYDMSQNYPNPFNPVTRINFEMPYDGIVSLKLFDISGKEVATILNEMKTSGYHNVSFNASNLSSGVYFYNIKVNNFTSTKKMLLVK